MKRNKILTADWHIRASSPQYRVDDYAKTILNKIEFIVETANKYNADIIVAGDIFHNIKVGIRTINKLIQILRKLKGDCYTVPGQHDLEGHNETLDPTPYYNLMEAGVICNLSSNPVNNIYGVGWEQALGDVSTDDESILVVHHCITPDKPPFFLEDSAMSAQEILDSCAEFQYIVSGDYHVPFVIKDDGRYLINCGSISRSNKDQIDYQPMIHLLEIDKNKVTSINIPIEAGDKVFHIPNEISFDSQFSDHIQEILDATSKDEKPDFITTVRVIMKDESFTDKQRELADKYYNDSRES